MKRGFTLVELLLAISLVLVIAAVSITATMQMLHMTRRLQALQAMDSAAGSLFEKLSGEIAAMHPCTAVWLHSDATTDEVELLFMHASDTPGDNRADLLWSRWHWNAGTKVLTCAVSRPSRSSAVIANQARNYWQIGSGSKMNGTLGSNAGSEASVAYYNTFLSVPQPLRVLPAPANPAAVSGALDANRWSNGEDADIGDYTELRRRSVPLLHECTSLRLELVDRAGTVQVAHGDVNLDWSAPGSHSDGRDHPDLDRRPGLLRISFTLTEPETALNQSRSRASRTYSFSCPAPDATGY